MRPETNGHVQDLPAAADFRGAARRFAGGDQVEQPKPAAKAAPKEDKRPGFTRLQVTRIAPGDSQIILTLGDGPILGMMTHFRRHSIYCPGKDECPTAIHRLEPTWKGYVACLVKVGLGNTWRPCCLEVTESLEREMRHVLKRGQVWNVWQMPKRDKGKPAGVEGKLLETVDASTLPQPFDIRPVLVNLYHVPDLKCDRKNPLPDLIYVEDVAGPIPEALRAKEDAAPFEGSIKERYEQAMKAKKAPIDQAKDGGENDRRRHVL